MAAISRGWPTLTWRSSEIEDDQVTSLEIWDLERHQLLYRGFPRQFWEKARVDPRRMEWSPDGEWLLVVADNAWDYYGDQQHRYGDGRSENRPFKDDEWVLLLMRRDGSDPTVVECHQGPQDKGPAYAWDLRPGRHGVYAFVRDGSLVRHDLNTGRAERVWAGLPAPAEGAWRSLDHVRIAPSPDGTTVAVAVEAYPYPPGRQRQGMDLLVFALPADRAASPKAATTPVACWTASIYHAPRLAWSEDGRALCAAAVGWRGEDPRWMLWTMRWQPGSAAAVTAEGEDLGVHEDTFLEGLAPIPHTGRFLLRWFAGEMWVVDESAQLQPLPEPLRLLGRGADLVAFDNQGRAIVELFGKKSKLAAVDITTGKVTDIYP